MITHHLLLRLSVSIQFSCSFPSKKLSSDVHITSNDWSHSHLLGPTRHLYRNLSIICPIDQVRLQYRTTADNITSTPRRFPTEKNIIPRHYASLSIEQYYGLRRRETEHQIWHAVDRVALWWYLPQILCLTGEVMYKETDEYMSSFLPSVRSAVSSLYTSTLLCYLNLSRFSHWDS